MHIWLTKKVQNFMILVDDGGSIIIIETKACLRKRMTAVSKSIGKNSSVRRNMKIEV